VVDLLMKYSILYAAIVQCQQCLMFITFAQIIVETMLCNVLSTSFIPLTYFLVRVLILLGGRDVYHVLLVPIV
jgi:hypothetical protein